MRAVTFSRFGGPEVLQVTDLPVPEPGPGEASRVAAATANPTDISFRLGRQTVAQLKDAGALLSWSPGMGLAGLALSRNSWSTRDAAAPRLAHAQELRIKASGRRRLGQLVTQGRLTPRVAETFPPERAAEAQRKLDAGGGRGRLLIVF